MTTECIPLIVGSARSGTWLLTHAIAKHPAFTLVGEVLNITPHGKLGESVLEHARHAWAGQPNALRWGLPPTNGDWGEPELGGRVQFEQVGCEFPPVPFRLGRPLLEYVQSVFWPQHVYKILYGQLPPHWRQAWQAILEIKGVRLIHNVRENWLEIAVSNRAANRSKYWFHAAGQEPINDDQPFAIEAVGLADFFASMQRCVDFHRFVTRRTGGVEVNYDVLVERWDEEVKRLHEYLGVDPVRLQPSSSKRTGKRPSELLSNYKNLKEAFRGSRWQRFFVD